MKNYFVFPILFFAIIFLGCKNDHVKTNDILWVVSNNGLRLREKPDIKSKVLIVVPYGDEVKSLKNEIPVVIDDISGNWLNLKYNEFSGWAFDGYLRGVFNSNAIIVNEKIGNFETRGLDLYNNLIYTGPYTKLLYNNNFIAFIDLDANVQLIGTNADSCIFREIVFENKNFFNIDKEANIYGNLGKYYLFKNKKVIPLDKFSNKIDNYFSSAVVLNSSIYAWGFDKKNNNEVYAIKINPKTYEVKEEFLSEEVVDGTDNPNHFKEPTIENGIVFYRTEKVIFKLNEKFQLIK